MQEQTESTRTGDSPHVVRHVIVRMLVYSTVAVIFYFVGKLFWWLGLILVVIFGLHVLAEIVVSGTVVLIGLWALRIVFLRATDYRVFNSERFGKLRESVSSLAAITGLQMLAQLYYVLLTFVLGYFLLF